MLGIGFFIKYQEAFNIFQVILLMNVVMFYCSTFILSKNQVIKHYFNASLRDRGGSSGFVFKTDSVGVKSGGASQKVKNDAEEAKKILKSPLRIFWETIHLRYVEHRLLYWGVILILLILNFSFNILTL